MNTPGYAAAVLAHAAAAAPRRWLAALRSRLRQLGDPQAGLLPGEVLSPSRPAAAGGAARAAARPAGDGLGRLVVVELNGRLGSGMGLTEPKSLLEVKPGVGFLDVLAQQVLALRERHGAQLPLVLVNSAAAPGPSPGGAAPLRRAGRARRAAGLPAGPRAQDRCRWLTGGALQAEPGMSGARPGTATSTPRSPRPAPWTPCSAPGCGTPSCPTPTTSARSPTSGSPPGSPPAGAVRAEGGPRTQRTQGRTPGPLPGPGGARRAGIQQRHLVTDARRWRWYNTNNIWIDLRALADLQAANRPDQPCR